MACVVRGRFRRGGSQCGARERGACVCYHGGERETGYHPRRGRFARVVDGDRRRQGDGERGWGSRLCAVHEGEMKEREEEGVCSTHAGGGAQRVREGGLRWVSHGLEGGVVRRQREREEGPGRERGRRQGREAGADVGRTAEGDDDRCERGYGTGGDGGIPEREREKGGAGVHGGYEERKKGEERRERPARETMRYSERKERGVEM